MPSLRRFFTNLEGFVYYCKRKERKMRNEMTQYTHNISNYKKFCSTFYHWQELSTYVSLKIKL